VRAFALLLAVAASAVALTAAAGSGASVGCTRAAAKSAVLAAPGMRAVWPTVKEGGGVETLICHDLTRDGRVDMAATIFSGGTAGDIAWAVFLKRGGRWTLSLRQLQAYKLVLRRAGSDLVETTPVYERDDPNCCPSGGFDHRRFHWNGTRFVVVKRWHTARFAP